MNDVMDQEKMILELKMTKIKEQLENDIMRQKRQYDELVSAKNQLDFEYKQTFTNLEEKHLKGVEELESLYERKLAFENEKFM